MSPTSYGNLGESKGGDPNIMKLEATNKVRPLDNMVAEYRQHTIEDPNDPEKITMVVCPGPRSCPLCRKPADPKGEPYWPVSRRFAACVWDYSTNSIKVLIAGPQVFDEFKTAAKLGIDPSSCDWTIVKEGARKQTKYQVVRHNAEPGPPVTPEQLLDIAKYEAPDSAERIFEILEQYGIDYDMLPIPEFTLDEALAFVMPYTKHKGLTVEKVLEVDPDFAVWMHGAKLEQGQLGDPVFIAFQTAMQERGMVKPLEDALASLPAPQQVPPAQSQAPAAAPEAAPADAGIPDPGPNEVRLIANNGVPVNVPESSADSLLAAGFTKPEPPAPVETTAEAEQPDANTPTEVVIGGQVVVLPRIEAVKLVSFGTASYPETQAAPAPAVKIPLPDEEVQLNIGGTVVPMIFAQAEQLVASGSATFVDEEIAAAVQSEKDKADRDAIAAMADAEHTNPTAVPAPAAAVPAPDVDLPNVCPHCNKGYKSKGGLTQHINREHAGAAAPAQSQAPAAAPEAAPADAGIPDPGPNDGTDAGLLERVKDKIARSPFARSYDKLLEMFKEETGKSNVMEMSEPELMKLEARIDKETAAA
jgi:hypothetical protein